MPRIKGRRAREAASKDCGASDRCEPLGVDSNGIHSPPRPTVRRGSRWARSASPTPPLQNQDGRDSSTYFGGGHFEALFTTRLPSVGSCIFFPPFSPIRSKS